MRGSGAALSPSRNGGRQRSVEESDYFKQRCALYAPQVPRLREVLHGVREQLAHNAEEYGTLIEGEPGRWVVSTFAGHGAPVLWVYYSLTSTECCLEFLVVPGIDPPAPDPDTTIL